MFSNDIFKGPVQCLSMQVVIKCFLLNPEKVWRHFVFKKNAKTAQLRRIFRKKMTSSSRRLGGTIFKRGGGGARPRAPKSGTRNRDLR